MADVDAVVIGAGVVGLAVGAAFARRGQTAIVLERHAHFGEETSSRNSEVIHAGMYYPVGSLKARLAVAGRHMMYAYCAARGVAAQKTTKIIIAVEEHERADLDRIMDQGLANGVEGLEMIAAPRIRALEPAVTAIQAIYSPESGIVDSHGLMLALLGEIEDAGGALARAAPFERASPTAQGWRVQVGGAEPAVIETTCLVNAAGLGARAAALAIEGVDPASVPIIRYAKGNYFRYEGKAPFQRLVYPTPALGSQGLHVTPDMSGRARFGPDVEPVEEIDYRPNVARRAMFAAAIRRFWPGVEEEKLAPDYAGIRPKIGPSATHTVDFRIDDPAVHGLAGLVNLFGIDSPGLTASLALGEETARRLTP